jgi:phenylalanyl-tRNA synthetase alpha subunit
MTEETSYVTPDNPVVINKSNILQKIIEMAKVLDYQNIPESDRWIEFHGCGIRHPRSKKFRIHKKWAKRNWGISWEHAI